MSAWPASPPIERPGPAWPTGRQAARLRPSAWWYVAAVVVLVAGAAAGVAVVRRGFDDVDRRLRREVTRYPVNEQGIVSFDATGTYTLYFERPTSLLGADHADELVDKLDIRFVEAATGDPVMLESPESGDADVHGGMERVPIRDFAIEQAGDYLLEVRTSDFPPETSSVSVGRDPYRTLGRDLVAGFWLIGASAVGAVATAVGVGVTRGRTKRAHERPAWSGHGSWPA